MPDEEDDAGVIYGNSELEIGVFSLVISWVHMLTIDGLGDEQAREQVATYLDKVAEALRSYNNTEGVNTND